MFETTSRPYLAWQDYGKMVNAAKPKGLVVVSAHWEDEAGGSGVTGQPDSRLSVMCRKLIETVNTDETNPLIYDFYNFPKHF